MALRLMNNLTTKLIKEPSKSFLAPALQTAITQEQVRYRRTKHWNPKWKQLRRQKFIKVDIPDFNETWDNLTEEETRAKLKEQGLLPPRPWLERPFFLSSTGGVFEAYVPPEGDGKVSPISAQGAKQSLQFLEKKTKTMLAIRKIRSFDEDFDTPQFCKDAEKIYIKSHECLSEGGNMDDIIEYVTERAYPEVVHNSKGKTIRWKHLKNIELPRVVHARCTDIVTKENIFAQVTVRFHTQQLLAVYDRFGRLMHGSEILAKDVLEYVVFEKHLANEYGKWRVHDKIIPDWMPPREPSGSTFKKIAAPIKQEKVKELPGDSKEQVKEITAPAP